MSDGSDGGGIRKQIGGTFEDIGEAIVKPVANEGMKAAEQGVKSVVAPQQQTNQNSQQPAAPDQSQVKQQEQDGLLEARRQIQHWQILDQGQKKVREVQKQQKTEKKQEEQKREEIQQYTIVKKKEEDKNRAVQQHQKRTETRGGLGG